MKIKKSTLTTIFVLVCITAVISIFAILLSSAGNSNEKSPNTDVVTIEGDKQIIDITARGGYYPMTIEAKGGKETTLRVSTNNSFDCSTALTIPSLNVSEILPATGKTEISLGSPKSGEEIDGTCSMGMYSFKIKFI